MITPTEATVIRQALYGDKVSMKNKVSVILGDVCGGLIILNRYISGLHTPTADGLKGGSFRHSGLRSAHV
jgi:hypothetical protein